MQSGSDGATGDTASVNGNHGPEGTARPQPSVIGMLVFESLGNRKVPVLEGVTAQDLAKGAAHHPRTSPPGAAGNCVIFGHRDTVFRGFDKLKVGDVIRLEVPGNAYSYKIVSMAVVEPGDPRIFMAYGGRVMTLVTCYPFRYVGSAPQRYIVVAQLQ
jgi:sortase A